MGKVGWYLCIIPATLVAPMLDIQLTEEVTCHSGEGSVETPVTMEAAVITATLTRLLGIERSTSFME